MARKNFLSGEIVRLLRRVEKRILEEPKRFDMDLWGSKQVGPDAPACGTVACIAGWAGLDGLKPARLKRLSDAGVYRRGHRGADKIGKLLQPFRVDDGETLLGTGSSLFYVENWPGKFRDAYGNAYRNGQRGRAARIAVNRIEHFIKTGE